MSGDVQPRKRKDKKKKKGELFLVRFLIYIWEFYFDHNKTTFFGTRKLLRSDEVTEEVATQQHHNVVSSTNDDINIHVHKEGGTGGGICAKLIFFVLLTALAVVIGLIITEHRGLTDCKLKSHRISVHTKQSPSFSGHNRP